MNRVEARFVRRRARSTEGASFRSQLRAALRRSRCSTLVPGLRRFWCDERGQSTTTTMGFALTWFITFFVFMMNVQLGQLFHRRDAVDHAAAIAADTAKKTFCAKEENSQATEQEAKQAIQAVLDTAADANDCQLSIRPKGEANDPGSKELDVGLECKFDCMIPVAAQVMCKGGSVTFNSKLKTVALGCDGKGT